MIPIKEALTLLNDEFNCLFVGFAQARCSTCIKREKKLVYSGYRSN